MSGSSRPAGFGNPSDRALIAVLVAALSALAPACSVLANLSGAASVTPPAVQFQGATLARAPTQRGLEAYYCPGVVPDPMGLPAGAALLCRGLFGPKPPATDLVVAFDLKFKVSNPNKIPVPLAEVLAGVTVFPATGNPSLGAACVRFCAPDQPGCTGQSDPGGCQASSRDIRSISDFSGATRNLLMAAGIATVVGQPLTFTAPMVAASAELDVAIRYSFGPEELLSILKQVASQSITELKTGRPITFNIPFRIEGTVWFDIGSFGRVPVAFGPVEGTWVLPTDGL